jgi:hypothetical protein
MAFRRRGVEIRLVLPAVAIQNDRSRCDPTLIKAIARGRAWFEELAAGRARSLRELAERDGITRRYVRRRSVPSLLLSCDTEDADPEPLTYPPS